ncbi:MAG: FKBP-type peptidyl-prolyl cis-trans isomerase [Bacteroidota bacterium]|nr:FKBP-type peptidyl-prolyl cis-trans isomerase [Bacteroidota bacterium]
MKRTTQFFAIALAAMSMVACKNTDYKKTKEGFPYKIFSDGKGEKILPGYVVSYHMTNKLEDSLMGTTYGSPTQWLPIPKEGPSLEKMRFFLEARKGDSILLIQPIDSLMAKNPQAAQDPFLKANKGKQIKTWLKIVEVYKDEDLAKAAQEKEGMEAFFKDPGIQKQKAVDESEIEAYLKKSSINATRTPLGTYIHVLKPGTGEKAKSGQYLTVLYTGKLLSGEVFDTNEKPGGQPMQIQLGTARLVPGFDDALKQLSKGERAMVFIPSIIGYGAQGGQPNAQGVQVIKPNQSLIFEIELVDISDKQPAPRMMPQTDTTTK